MAESQVHIDLVNLICKYLQFELNIEPGFILKDTPDTSKFCKPPKIKDYRPDVYVRTSKNLLIIGEAKTEYDWDRKHSHNQYTAYIDECLSHNENSIIIVAVPWTVERSVRSRFKYLFPKELYPNICIIVLSNMWGG